MWKVQNLVVYKTRGSVGSSEVKLFLLIVAGKAIGQQQLVKKRPLEGTKAAVTLAKRQKTLHSEKAADAEAVQGDPVELDERTTQILEEELQAVMIKVWQSLPDSPHSAAERYVAERLRNEASDDIRNVLGLNVTKRLLNVFNPLFLRVHFTRPPDSAHLKHFLKSHNIKEFKQHQHHRNLYVARVRDIADFDRLCTANNQKCGNAKVTIKPSYRFSQFPAKLNTIFVKRKSKGKKDNENTEEKGALNKETAETPSNEKKIKQPTATSQTKQVTVINKNDQPPKTTIASDKKLVTVQNETSSVKKEQTTFTPVTKPKPNQLTPNVKPVTTPPKGKPNQEVITKKLTESTKPIDKSSTINIKAKVNQNNQENVTTKKYIEAKPKLAVGPNTVANIKPNSNQIKEDVANNKEAIQKQTVKPVTPSNTKLQPNEIKQDGVATNQVKENIANNKEVTQKPTIKAVTPSNTKPQPNQIKQDGVATNQIKENIANNKEVTQKPTVKPVAPSTTKPQPNQIKQDGVATKKVTETTPKSSEKSIAPTDNKPKANPTNPNVATKKINETTPKATEKTVVASNIKPKENQNKQEAITTKKTIETAPKSVAKPTVAVNNTPKPKQANQKVLATKKIQPTPKSPVKNITKPKEVATKKALITRKFIAEPFDETDEMNDEEILALISTGIVVDECSGSDEE